jgi:trehalose/maltose hydrolase-like predicted phosphorylase
LWHAFNFIIRLKKCIMYFTVQGIEQNPGNGEDHLQGDIALAFVQHWQATGDLTWLREKGFPVIEGLARFWASRVDHDSDGSWHIRGSTSPDEYSGNSSDPVYTTAIAQITLQAAHELAPIVDKQPDPEFLEVAEGLKLLYDQQLNFHPEHVGWNFTKIKQADVVMLGYPLAYEMPLTTQQNDLAIYAKATDPNGPGMTWSIHSIVYRDIGNETEAAAYFLKGYESYVRGAFKTWHEGYGVFGGVTTFITVSELSQACLRPLSTLASVCAAFTRCY